MGWLRGHGASGSLQGRLRGRSPARPATLRRARRLRHAVAGALAPVLAAGSSLVPVVFTVSAVVAVSAAGATVAAAPAQAATKTVLILSTSVNGGSASAEAAAAVAAGATVTVDTATQWDALTTAQFAAFSAIIIGDPSTTSCATTVPSDALSTAATWGAAVTGNVSVIGTAPALAGSAGTAVLKDAISYAVSGATTGLYVSLNCDYASSTSSAVPLLADVDGGGFTVTGHGSACPDSGRVNTGEADALTPFNGLAGTFWAAPACSVEETFTAWPAALSGVAYLNGAAPADFTASDGQTGQPFALAGAPASTGTLALAPAAGGEVPAGATTGGANPAAPGVTQATAGDPVNTENGDFTQSASDLSIPTFGPSLGFSRTYDAALAQQQTKAGTPGPMGYGWTDNWATSLATGQTGPGDIYTVGGLATDTGEGGPATSAAVNNPGAVYANGGDVYYADTLGNRVEEVPGTSGTQWGIAMTAGDVYTIAGSDTGKSGASATGTAAAASLLDQPGGVTLDGNGNLYIADTGNARILEIPAASGNQRGVSPMTADDIYVIAGRTGEATIGIDNKAATASDLDDPTSVHMGSPTSEDLYIADSGNNRVQEIAAVGETEWGQGMTANFVYTIAGSSTGVPGSSGDGGPAASGLLDDPQGVTVSGGDMYIADTLNDRVQEVPGSSGEQWGITPAFTALDMYTVAGRTGDGTIGLDGKTAVTSDLNDPTAVRDTNGGNLYIADSQNERIQEVAGTAHTEFGQAMTANLVYTIAGSPAGTTGYSGNGGVGTAALMNRPTDVFLDGATVYLADTGNNEIRKVSGTAGNITDVAGGVGMFAQDGNGGNAASAGLSGPFGIASDVHGDIFVADTSSNRVQEIAAASHTQFGITMTAGDAYTVAGSPGGYLGSSGDGGLATSARLNQPTSVAVDPSGNLYIADSINNRIQEVAAATGNISTIAGSGPNSSGDTGNGGPAASALLDAPYALATDAAGDLFIAGNLTQQVQEIPAATGNGMTKGDIYALAGTGNDPGATGDNGVATAALLRDPEGIAVDPAGNVYIGDLGNNRIQEIAGATAKQWGISMTKGDIYTIAGSATGATHSGNTGDGGPATAALLASPGQLATDAAGDLYITDAGNNRVREVAAASGIQRGQQMTTGDIYNVAGDSDRTAGNSGDGGPAATASKLNGPVGVGTDPAGNLFITDSLSNRLREVMATATPLFTTSPVSNGITITQPDGSQVTFYPKVSGACTAPYVTAGATSSYCTLPQNTAAALTANTTANTYSYTPTPGTTYTYAWDGAVTAVTDAAGNALTVAYATPAPGSGQCPASSADCETVTSASGRALVIGFFTSGRVATVTDLLGRTWQYNYASSDLTEVIDPMGHITTYTYGAGSTGNPLLASDLLTITSPNAQPGGPDAGKSTVNVYDAFGRVTTQTDPMGFATTFNYCVNAAAGNCLNTATGNGTDTVTDPDGNTTVYAYDQGTLTAQSTFTGTALTSEQDSIPDTTAGGSSGGTLLDTTIGDGDGNITTSTYDAAGNVTSTTAPDGTGSQTATTTQASTALNNASCSSTAEAVATCTGQPGPTPVVPGGVITPPAAAPPMGLTYMLYDNDGNQLYTTTGVYQPGATTASRQQATYHLFKNNSVTLGGVSITCAATPPSQSLPCAAVNADGVVTQFAYYSAGDLKSSATPDGAETATTTYVYDADGEQTGTTAPDGNLTGANVGNYTTVTAYNADGNKTSVIQAGGSGATATPRTTTYGYDADSNQATSENARSNTTTTVYNADDQPTLVTDPVGDAALTCYDGDGHSAQVVPPTGVAVDSLTPASCPSSYPSGYGHRLAGDATTYTFDADGSQTATTTPPPVGQSGSETTTSTYDGDGNLLSTTQPPASNASGAANEVTTDTYNSAGGLATETTAASTTSYCYDPNGDQTAVISPDGNTSGVALCGTSSSHPYTVDPGAYPSQESYQTTSSYDSASELVSTTTPATTAAPGGATTTSAYDPAGNKLTSTDPNGVTTTRTYTPGNQVATVAYSGSSAHSVSYTYDADGSKTAMTDATGTSSYTYDPFSELVATTSGAGQTSRYAYDADGDTTGITYPVPSSATWATTDTVGYGYSNADILSSVTDFNGNQITVTSDSDSVPGSVLPTSEALGSTGDTIKTAYDNTDAPRAITVASGSTTLQSFTYADAPSGSILSETDVPTTSKSPAGYTYDTQDRVTSMTPGTGSALDYGFDASGNLTTLPTGATGTYDRDSELTSSALSGTTTSYSNNADGERLTATQGSVTTAAATWNGAGELAAYDDAAADMSAVSYDGAGVRASATTGSASQTFTWNTTTAVPQLLMDSTSAYIYAIGAAPSEQVSLSTGAITYLATDSLGSVRGTISSAGALTGTTSYDAWGNPATADGLTAVTPFGYAGSYTDPTGLIYLINRYYDPQTGQFSSIDPMVSQTLEPYLYAGDNPVSDTDQNGDLHSKWNCIWHWGKKCLVYNGVDLYFTYKFTYGLATAGVIVFLPVIAVINAIIERFWGDGNPFGEWVKEKFDHSLEGAYEEARKIVGTTEEQQENYLHRQNKRCLKMSAQAKIYGPGIYSESYRVPKAWCVPRD